MRTSFPIIIIVRLLLSIVWYDNIRLWVGCMTAGSGRRLFVGEFEWSSTQSTRHWVRVLDYRRHRHRSTPTSTRICSRHRCRLHTWSLHIGRRRLRLCGVYVPADSQLCSCVVLPPLLPSALCSRWYNGSSINTPFKAKSSQLGVHFSLLPASLPSQFSSPRRFHCGSAWPRFWW